MAAHTPTRSARRTPRGSRAPNACAARGATAATKTHADGKCDEQHRVREAGAGNDMLSEAAEEHEIGRHHRDLAELRQRNRHRERDGLRHLVSPDARGLRVCAARRGRPTIRGHAFWIIRSAGAASIGCRRGIGSGRRGHLVADIADRGYDIHRARRAGPHRGAAVRRLAPAPHPVGCDVSSRFFNSHGDFTRFRKHIYMFNFIGISFWTQMPSYVAPSRRCLDGGWRR